jgi:hypothetical protein
MQVAPFNFGTIAGNVEFTDRESESAQLKSIFRNSNNVVLISPRRWGKTSLVHQTVSEMRPEEPRMRFVFLDAFRSSTEEEFLEQFARQALKASYSTTEEILDGARRFLSRLIPKLSVGIDPQAEMTLSFDWAELKKHPEDVLDLPQKLADEKDQRWVVCIDEFQNIMTFNKPDAFQKLTRSMWQFHNRVSYCLYGSRRHMMTDIFKTANRPFYKFGVVIFLEKIAHHHLSAYVQRRFVETGKSIHAEAADCLVSIMERHPFYVQMLAHHAWIRTSSGKTAGVELVKEAHSSIVQQLGLMFYALVDLLTSTQLNFLKALLAGEAKFTSKQVLDQYRLGTSGNIKRIKESLVDKEILDIYGGKIEFMDPVFKAWLQADLFQRI